MKYDEFVEKLDTQLQSSNCTIWRNLEISPTRQVALFTTRVHWRLLRAPVHLIVDHIIEPTPADFIALLDEALLYSKRAFSQGPKGWISSFAMIPLIACESIKPEAVEHTTKRQRIRKHLKNNVAAMVYLPVLYSLRTNELYYWTGFNFVGCFVWPVARQFIEENIGAVVKGGISND